MPWTESVLLVPLIPCALCSVSLWPFHVPISIALGLSKTSVPATMQLCSVVQAMWSSVTPAGVFGVDVFVGLPPLPIDTNVTPVLSRVEPIAIQPAWLGQLTP